MGRLGRQRGFHGRTHHGDLTASYRFQKSFIEVNETLRDHKGKLLHEDCTDLVQRINPYLQATQLWLPESVKTIGIDHHFGCRWWMGPQAPWVELINVSSNKIRLEIKLPTQEEPETWIDYRRD